MENIKNAIIKSNLQIVEYIEKELDKDDYLYTNDIGFGGDRTLKIDSIFENIFIENLKEFGNIFSEECGFIDNQKDITFIIDPLDGSNNFFSDVSYFGTSIAIKKNNEILAGFVANLANKTLVYRVLNEDISYFCLSSKKEIKKIVKGSKKLSIFERGYKYPNVCKTLSEKGVKFRILGATALSLANARDFNFVLFMGELRDFDLEAGLYISKDLYIIKKSGLVFVTENEELYNNFKEIIKQF